MKLLEFILRNKIITIIAFLFFAELTPIAPNVALAQLGSGNRPTVLQGYSEQSNESVWTDLYLKFRKFAWILLLIGLIVAGILAAFQKYGLAIAVFIGALILGGGPYLIGLISSVF